MSDEFAYNLAACRQYQAANLQGVVQQPPSPGMMPYQPLMPASPASAGDAVIPTPSSNGASNPSYLYSTRTMYPINGTWTPPYSTDGSVSPIYPTVPNTTQEVYSMGMFTGSRQPSQSSAMYTENHGVYSYNGEGSSSAQEHHQPQQRQQTLARRSPSVSPDRDAFSLHSVANALNTSSGHHNVPSMYRSASTSMQSYSRSTPPSSITGNMSPVATMTNTHQLYQGYDSLYNGNASAFTASQMSRMSEHYAPTSVTGHMQVQDMCMRPAGPSPELSYRYGPVNYIGARPLRSPPVSAMVPSQQYMLSGNGTHSRRSMAFMTPGHVQEEEEDNEDKYKPSN